MSVDLSRHPFLVSAAESLQIEPEQLVESPVPISQAMGVLDALLVAVTQFSQPERDQLAAVFLGDRCPLAPSVTEESANGFASAIFGLHRVDPTSRDGEMHNILSAVAEIVAAPFPSEEQIVLYMLAIVARERWRGRGMTRNPRDTSSLMGSCVSGLDEPTERPELPPERNTPGG
jgi:hypothetical protein